MQKSHLGILFLVIISVFTIQCGSSNNAHDPLILKRTPVSGVAGSQVYLQLENFDPATDIITFSGVPVNISDTLDESQTAIVFNQTTPLEDNQEAISVVVPDLEAGKVSIELWRDNESKSAFDYLVTEEDPAISNPPANDPPSDGGPGSPPPVVIPTPEIPDLDIPDVTKPNLSLSLDEEEVDNQVRLTWAGKNIESALVVLPVRSPYSDNRPNLKSPFLDGQFKGQATIPFGYRPILADEIDEPNSIIEKLLSYSRFMQPSLTHRLPINYCLIPRKIAYLNKSKHSCFDTDYPSQVELDSIDNGYNYVAVYLPIRESESGRDRPRLLGSSQNTVKFISGSWFFETPSDENAITVYYKTWAGHLEEKHYCWSKRDGFVGSECGQ